MPRASGTMPRPRRALRWGARPVTSSPSSEIVPTVRPYEPCSPMRQRSMVVLPAPLRPTRVTISPASTCYAPSRRACASPYQADSSSTRSMGVSEVGGDAARVVPDLGVRALDEHLAVLQDGRPLGEAGDHVDVVLGEDHGATRADPPEELDGALDVLAAHPGG